MENVEEFRIIRSPRRRRVALRIAPDGVAELLAPPGVPDSVLRQIFESEQPAIERLKLRAQRTLQPRWEEGEQFFLLGKRYPLHFTRRVRLFDGETFLVPRGDAESVHANFCELYKELAAGHLRRKLTEWETRTGLSAEKMRISSASTRWGSCTATGTITFSWKLLQCPPELIDYVIVHELAHRREMNHSPRFWKVVASFCPEYRSRRAALRRFSLTLPRF